MPFIEFHSIHIWYHEIYPVRQDLFHATVVFRLFHWTVTSCHSRIKSDWVSSFSFASTHPLPIYTISMLRIQVEKLLNDWCEIQTQFLPEFRFSFCPISRATCVGYRWRKKFPLWLKLSKAEIEQSIEINGLVMVDYVKINCWFLLDVKLPIQQKF